MIFIYTWLTGRLAEDYKDIRLLKDGPRGSVRLIAHRASGRLFILRQFTGGSAVYCQLTQYSCKYLPKIFEAAEKDGRTLVIEEYISGDTLGFLLEESLFTPGETRKIVFQLCQALWALHSLGAVHRDVKPENVILRGADAVLIDFDAARFYKLEAESDTQILGTAGFAAPEQYGMSQSDFRADIYAVGILMNVMLTGEHPSRRLAGGRLGRVVERCTSVNPEKRYQSVLHLMEAL